MLDPERKAVILIVDDAIENIQILAEFLKPYYDVKIARNGRKAIDIALEIPGPDLILLDVVMPEMDGYEVCRHLKITPHTAEIPIIFITSRDEKEDEEKGLNLGAVDYICKPVSAPIVLKRVQTHLALYDQNRQLSSMVKQKTDELRDTRLKIIQRLGRAAEYRDNETGVHVIRMSHTTRLIAKAMRGNDRWVEMLFHAAPMHDVGKIGIPDGILLKPGKLDKDEMEIMKKHAEYGATIVGSDHDPLLTMASSIALTHHEKWDGSGYPRQLKGEAIPLEARIVAVADVFDALMSSRPYKLPWTKEQAVDYIEKSRGIHFDPQVVDYFHQVFPEICLVLEQYADE